MPRLVRVCGRYTNTASPSYLADHLGLAAPPPEVSRHYNIAPTDEVQIAVDRDGQLEPRVVRWGLVPHWSRDAKGAARMINARVETVAQRPAFRDLLAEPRRRCLVLADGYYEWLRSEDPKQPRLPMRFALAGDAPFAFAGLTASWRRDDGEWLRTCTILTTRANRVAAPVHDRMPVMLADAEARERWLREEAGPDLLAAIATPPGNDALHVAPANPLVNAVANDGPELLVAPG